MRLTLHNVPARNAIKFTLALIKRMALEGSQQPEVKRAAVQILESKGIYNGRNLKESAEALTDWIGENIKYYLDPAGTEMVTAATRTLLDLKYGDCDDMAVLLGALLMSIGIPIRFRIVGQGRPSHIFVEGRVENGWYSLDPVALNSDPDPNMLKTFFLEGY